MPTYNDQLNDVNALTNSLVYENSVRAITGTNHNLQELGQNASMFANLVAYDNYAYKIVRTYDTDTENGQSLKDAYADAITLTPGGKALSINNRVAILVPPGTYALGTTGLTMNTQFVDLIGLGRADETIITSVSNTGTGLGTIIQTTNNIKFRNLTIQNSAAAYSTGTDQDDSGYAPQGVYPSVEFTDCVFNNPGTGGNGAPFMRLDTEYSGSFTRCRGVDGAGVSVFFAIASGNYFDCHYAGPGFGYAGEASGVFTDCSCTDGFGFLADASGSFARCTAFNSGFGSGGNASGNFNNCTALTDSFGWGVGFSGSGSFYSCRGTNNCFGDSSSTGYFEDCTVTDGGFGPLTSAVSMAGTYIRCSGENGSFGAFAGSTLSGTFTDCVGGNNSFGGSTGATLSGTFTGCIAGNLSFGGDSNSVLIGSFNYCKAGDNSFGRGENGLIAGEFDYCKAGNASFGHIAPTVSVTGPTLAGVFRNCVAGIRSFGSSVDSRAVITMSGQFYNCTSGSNSFGHIAIMSAGLEFHDCVAGDNSWSARKELGQSDGLFINCTGGDGCFNMQSSSTAKFINCTGQTLSFCAGMSSGTPLTLSGTYINCTASNTSFGWVPNGPAEVITLDGVWENCTSGAQSFGASSGNLTNVVCSGTFINCSAGDDSFASNGAGGGAALADAAGYFENCRAGFRSFGGTATGKKSGRLVRCTLVDRDGTIGAESDLGPLVSGGIMQDCTWVMKTTTSNALIVQSGAKVFGGLYKAGATATESIVSGGAATVSIANILTNVALGGSITNNISSPNVIVDPDV